MGPEQAVRTGFVLYSKRQVARGQGVAFESVIVRNYENGRFPFYIGQQPGDPKGLLRFIPPYPAFVTSSRTCSYPGDALSTSNASTSQEQGAFPTRAISLMVQIACFELPESFCFLAPS